MPRVRDLLDLPEHVGKGDFVLTLADGLQRIEHTVSTYVATPALVDAFDQALRLIGASLRDRRSKAAFLHGSFGSGKSHFMALLSLLLDHCEPAWGKPELHPLREKHVWLAETADRPAPRLLALHFHMIGEDSLEGAVFKTYLKAMRARHPDAPIPGVFVDERLFADAAGMLEELGDEAFFSPMNHSDDDNPDIGTEAGEFADEDWGEFADDVAGAWNRARFTSACNATDPEVRAELFNALVGTRFSAYASESRRFIDLDRGLAVIARHAAGLGYAGIVLFLDELILWLAGGATNSAWLHTEAQKMVKLVEAQDASRDIPLVSFIARQRDLAEMVGEEYAGVENARLRDSLAWSKGRFHVIPLEDRNLPAIVEQRVLVPRDKPARAALDQAFQGLKTRARTSWATLLGSDDAEAFRKLYPFSPALVSSLVALSNSLQRQRTAIKLLMELLVEHIDDLELGEVVRVGDLFDVLCSGEDTADGVMKSRFEVAKELYKYRFLPLLQDAHGTTTEARCQRLRPDHPTRIGCSNCPERACRTDNRLVKTLIVGALVPEIGPLSGMTASKLVQLNHGTIRVPIPGDEANHVAQKLRTWHSQVSQLHVGDQRDPTVSLVLEGVDVDPILAQARGADTDGARQRVVRDLLFDAMGVPKVADWGRDHKQMWHETARLGHLRFGNVRKMSADQLGCPAHHDWRLVVDYPFDTDNYGPNDDLAVIDRVREDSGGTWTLVWLPSFFSDSMNKLLGELVILEHILETRAVTRRYVAHLSVDNQSRAEHDLKNLRNAKRTRVLQVLEEAYGLARVKEGDLDSSRSLDQHLHVLVPGAALQPVLAANLADALDSYVPALLEARYPRHPRFTAKLTRTRVESLVERFGEIVDSEAKQIAADPRLVNEMAGTLAELGLVRTTDNAVILVEDRTLQDIENRRARKAVDAPTVAEIKRWHDDTGLVGLQPAAADLVVRCYARWASRTFMHYDKLYEPRAGQMMPEDVVLEKPDLPSPAAWAHALTTARACFGVAIPGRALHADNLERFSARLNAALAGSGQGDSGSSGARMCAVLPGKLRARLVELGMEPEVARMTTATYADTLCAQLVGKRAADQVKILAEARPQTSLKAVGASVARAHQVVDTLEDALVFGAFAQLAALRDSLPDAEELLAQVQAAIRQDEVIVALAPRLRQAAEAGQRLVASLHPPRPPPPPVHAGRVLVEERYRASGAAVFERLAQVTDRVRRALDDAHTDAGGAARFELAVTLRELSGTDGAGDEQ